MSVPTTGSDRTFLIFMVWERIMPPLRKITENLEGLCFLQIIMKKDAMCTTLGGVLKLWFPFKARSFELLKATHMILETVHPSRGQQSCCNPNGTCVAFVYRCTMVLRVLRVVKNISSLSPCHVL